MMHRKGYVLPLTFLLLVSMAIVVGSLVYVITAQFKGQGTDIEYAKCLYYAEAGMAKAVWYLKTPPYQGGYGYRIDHWPRKNLTESFGDGSYKLTVANGNDPLQVKITVVGYCGKSSRTLQAYYYTYPPAFNYAVFTRQVQLFDMYNNSRVSYASVYADNDVRVGPGAIINYGLVITPGHTVIGEGSYTLYPVPFPAPSFPTLDTSYYDSQIAIAAAQPPNNKDYSGARFLSGSTIYVNGNVSIAGSGWAMIIGPGQIVATGNINIYGSSYTYIGNNINLIANGNLTLDNNTTVSDDCVLFARQLMTIQHDFDNPNNVSFVCPGQITVYNNSNPLHQINGIMYGGSINFENGVHWNGSLMAGSPGAQNVLQNNARVYYRNISDYFPTYFPTVPPPGLAGAYSQVSGSWKEIK
jgi:acetyltransferase-like isoleucine patch superfamily enzyme